MGFLSNIFKKKSGGTFVGNLIRGGASAVTGGVLGSGVGLQQYEQQQAIKAQREYDAQLAQITLENSQAYQIGQGVGNNVNNTPIMTQVRNGQVQEWATRNYSLLVVGVLAVIGLTVYLVKRK